MFKKFIYKIKSSLLKADPDLIGTLVVLPVYIFLFIGVFEIIKPNIAFFYSLIYIAIIIITIIFLDNCNK